MARPNKDPHLEQSLELLNGCLVGAEEFLIDQYVAPKHPIVFVIGAQRSGTTVLTQSLATFYRISYPSNLIARFWRAPFLGALVSKSMGLGEENMAFRSDFGATGGANGPHEFSYFWRHWFPGSAHNARPWNLSEAHATLLKKEFAAWQAVGDEPLLFKNLLEVIPNIQGLAALFPTAMFVNISRDDLFVIQSTYESRKNYGGDHAAWFGVKPSNFREVMKTADPLLQIVEQVHYLKREIANSLASLPSSRSLHVRYEDLVADPANTIRTIEERCGLARWRRDDRTIDALDFRSGNDIRLSEEQVEAIRAHCRSLGRADV